MSTRKFEDEFGRSWKVTMLGSTLEVNGPREDGERLHDIARSCAYKLGIKQTQKGVPLEHVNEHRRIWYLVWKLGDEVSGTKV